MRSAPIRPWFAWAVLLLALSLDRAYAQTSTGTIAGIVLDVSGVPVAGANITVTSTRTGAGRTLVTSADGRYAVAFLTPGAYDVSAARGPLRSTRQTAIVQAGMSATIDLVVVLQAPAEAITITGAERLRDERHHVTGRIGERQIEMLPLNGRNVFEAAKVEPGVTAPIRLSGGRVFIAPLGAGLQTIPRIGFTRVTIDGANIETPGTVGSLLQVSPDAVDQVQVSTANFDIAIGPATSGAVDVVTKSGGSRFTVSGFSLYRDRRWSASPLIDAVPGGGTPPFRRYQAGVVASGPLRPRRAFFFAGYERHDQRDILTVTAGSANPPAFSGTFVSPYTGALLNARIDVRLSDRHRVFARHTHDTNRSRGPADGSPSLPSGWAWLPVRAHQTMAALTSVLGSMAVNELRVSMYVTRASIDPIAAGDCPPPCAGFRGPRIQLSDGGPPLLTLGSAPMHANRGRRFQVSDALVWQKNAHLLRLGFDWERSENALVSRESDPVTLQLWSPAAVRQRNPSIVIPVSFTTVEDFLQLPLRSFTTSVGRGEVLQRGFQPVRTFDVLRGYAADQWTVGPRLVVNAGVALSYEPGVLNDDLRKPGWLAPLVGGGGLDAPAAGASLSATIGAAWKATEDGRTIVRAGAGRYVESLSRTVALNLANERALLSPLGTGRLVVSGSNLAWNGRRLSFTSPTAFTGADLLAILPEIRASIEQSLSPDNRDFSTVNLDQSKEGRNLYDPSYTTPRAVHASIGIEHQVGDGLVLGADVVGKWFSHTFINGIDYNRFFSASGPVIPACTSAQRTDVTVICSNGSLYFDTTSGRARYAGVLLRVQQRLGTRGRILASYALGSFVGHNGTGAGTTEASAGRVFGFNNDDWSENFGPLPTDIRHILNVSGLVTVPWQVEVSFNLSAYSRPPFSAYVAGLDFNGDGTTNDLLPGTRVNQFGRSLNEHDLARLVADYNVRSAGTVTPGGQVAPFITLPAEFSFNDHFLALDVRLARTFPLGGSGRVTAFVDVFNVFNTMNLTGYSGNLLSPGTFGQPSGRVGQAFGSGGPRAAQLGLRLGF